MKKLTSLDKALTVLEAVAEEGSVGLNTLAQTTGYPPATVHRILSVLVRRHYAKKDPATKKYMLNIKCLELSSRLREQMGIIEVARPIMKKLMDLTGETVNLVVFENMEAMYIEQATNTHSLLRMFTRVGARTQLYCSGVGKAYLATSSEGEVAEYLRNVSKVKHTENTIVEESRFLRELELIRDRGYALDQEEVEYGVGCVATVIWKGKDVVGGLSISGPSSRVLNGQESRLGKEVIRASREISAGLAYG